MLYRWCKCQCYAEKNVNNSEETAYDYDNFSGEYKHRRWFAFLISRENNQLDGNLKYETVEDVTDTTKVQPQRLIYNTCVLYLLNYKEDCCDGFDNCPHKSLYRYVFKTDYDTYFGYNYDKSYTGNDEHYYTGTDKFKDELDNKVKLILENPVSNSVAKPYVVENNLVDLKIDKNDKQIIFYLTVLRISDAERHFKFGKQHPLTSLNSSEEFKFKDKDEAKKYIEFLSWASIPRNTINN